MTENISDFKSAIEGLPTSKRSRTCIYHALMRAGISSLGELSTKTVNDIHGVRNMGVEYTDLLYKAGMIRP